MSASEVRRELLARREIALLDVREEAVYADAHPLFAASLPLSQLELQICDRIPRRHTNIVVYDDGEEGLAEAAVDRLNSLGYWRVRILDAGLAGWKGAGYECFSDVNSASKAFGELVEARRHTPSLPAPEVSRLTQGTDPYVILDARRFEEYSAMSIPTGISVPGAELVLRARTLAPDPNTRIIVNCAGRTRSIIGAQSLINAGVPNPVAALRNGAIGWTLAGQQLDHGADRRYGDVDAETLAAARTAAREVAYRAGVRWIDADTLHTLEAERDRTLYKFDVRSPEEYAAGHLPGFRSAPGGQLVQETDVFAPVRGARVVLADDLGPRADMTASWLAQMAWDVVVLEPSLCAGSETGPWKPQLPPLPSANEIEPAALAKVLEAGKATLLDLAPSNAYRRGHIPGAAFVIRSDLARALEGLPQGSDFALTSTDGNLALLAAGELQALTGRAPQVLAGGTTAWVQAGLPLESERQVWASPPNDIYRRPYEGTDHSEAAMQAYLDWEYGLVSQLSKDASHGFFVI